MSTVWTNVRIKRLLMTLLNAQDFYDEKMYHLFYNIKNTANYRDDIFGGGKILRSMIKKLSKVLQIFNKKGLTLSTKKCHLAMKSLEFLGYVFIQHCLKPSRDNVNALEEELPESKEALRSFLDMVG